MYNFGRGRKSGGARATEATPSLAPLSMILFLIKMYFFFTQTLIWQELAQLLLLRQMCVLEMEQVLNAQDSGFRYLQFFGRISLTMFFIHFLLFFCYAVPPIFEILSKIYLVRAY